MAQARTTSLAKWSPGYGMTAFDDARNYGGEQLDAFVVYTKHRDSDLLTQSNYDGILAALNECAEKLGKPEAVLEPSFGHWAVGHVDQIMLAADAPQELIDCAEELKARLENYPVLDESDFSDREWQATVDYWDGMSPRDKVRAAMECRNRYHWLSNEPCWRFGRLSLSDLANDGSELGEALYELTRTYATE